jgi:hypothetical protein
VNIYIYVTFDRNICFLLSLYNAHIIVVIKVLLDVLLKSGTSVLEIYRAFHNALREYKYLLQENRKTRIYESCADRRNSSKMFSSESLFFILVHNSAARQCECM